MRMRRGTRRSSRTSGQWERSATKVGDGGGERVGRGGGRLCRLVTMSLLPWLALVLMLLVWLPPVLLHERVVCQLSSLGECEIECGR